MQFVLLTFVIGVLDLCLGYAIAVYLGYGPPSLWDAWDLLLASQPARGASSQHAAPTHEPLRGPDQALASHPDASLSVDPEGASDSAAEPELPALDLLRGIVAKGTSGLSDFTARLKSSHGGQPGRTSWSLVAELQQICEPYLRDLTKASERLSDDVGDPGDEGAVNDEVRQIILEQLAQLETTLSNLQYMDFDSALPTATMTRLSVDSENTLSVARSLQKALEAAPETADEQDAAAAAE